MNKKNMLYAFIKRIERHKLLTLFIKNIFDYDILYDYNYIFRIIMGDEMVIIDIYDNVSRHRFNRYIFDFDNKIKDIGCMNRNNVFLTYININHVIDSDNKLYKLAYLFSLDSDKMVDYATTFLDNKLVEILKK